jgi:VWFA-related protein
MNALSKSVVAALLVGVTYVAVDARQQAVFRSETNYIEIVASVTDRDGQFVTGLTAEDFEIREQGRRESVDSFSFVELSPSGRSATTAAFRPDVPTDLRTAEGRLYMIYLNGATPANTPMVRSLATQFVKDHLQPGDRAAIWDAQYPLREVLFTDDKAKLLADIEPYTGAGIGLDLPFAYRCSSGSNLEGLPIGQRAQCQAALAEPHSQLSKAIDWFNAIQGRRKSIVLFAGGWNGPTEPVSRADITLYAIDVRGLVAPGAEMLGGGLVGAEQAAAVSSKMMTFNQSVDGLYNLAMRTGGFAVINRNEYARGFERIVEANSQYYVLGYASSYTRRDRVFRDLDVKVKKSGLKVHARRGYYPRF